MKLLSTFFVLSCCSALFACGYHLSGTQQGEKQHFSSTLKVLHIDGINRYDTFRSVLIASLRGYGFKISQRQYATAQLQFSNKKIEERIYAFGDEAKASELLLRISVDFAVVDADGKVLLKTQRIHGETHYLTAPDRLVENETLRVHAKRKVEREITQRLIRRLAAIQ